MTYKPTHELSSHQLSVKPLAQSTIDYADTHCYQLRVSGHLSMCDNQVYIEQVTIRVLNWDHDEVLKLNTLLTPQHLTVTNQLLVLFMKQYATTCGEQPDENEPTN